MKAHDILSLTVFANAEQIENAYQGKLHALSDGNHKDQFPEAYKCKIEELARAREECLEYLNSSFLTKTKREIKDSMSRVVTANVSRASGCCCCCGIDEADDCVNCDDGTCCGGCCDVGACVDCDCDTCCCSCCNCNGSFFACIGYIVIAVLGGFGIWGISRLVGFVRREQRTAKQEEDRLQLERDTNRLSELNVALEKTKKEVNTAKSERDKAEINFKYIADRIEALNVFLNQNGVDVDLTKSNIYQKRQDELNACISRVNQLNVRVEQINIEINKIEHHNSGTLR